MHNLRLELVFEFVDMK